MRRVSILIPTFRRPSGLARAVRSAFAQYPTDALEIIVIDNAPEHSARTTLAMLETEAPCAFRWVHERRAGVASARNAALALASGDLIAWLDDDQEAPPHWLEALIAAHDATGADVVFGPVRARAGDVADKLYYERLYSREGPDQDGIVADAYGIGNSLMPRALLADAAFDIAQNETGGEDDRLFATLQARGARFGWAVRGDVLEHIDPKRLTHAYALRRAFAYGQGPSEAAYAARAHAKLVRHMLIGAAQSFVFGAIAAPAWAIGARQRLMLADRAARGLGKVLWFRPQRFYGASQPA